MLIFENIFTFFEYNQITLQFSESAMTKNGFVFHQSDIFILFSVKDWFDFL